MRSGEFCGEGTCFENAVDVLQYNRTKNSENTLKTGHLKAGWRQGAFHSVKCQEGYFQMEISEFFFFF